MEKINSEKLLDKIRKENKIDLNNDEIILYHGTSFSAWEKIKKEGIKPRGSKVGNWEDNFQGRNDLVYLSDCYPAFYAMNAIEEEDKGVLIRVKINTKKVRLYPDEEFIYQGFVGNKKDEEFYKSIDPREENKYSRMVGNEEVIINWEDSINYVGTVACDFVGIENIESYYITKSVELLYLCDGAVSFLNHKICSSMYRNNLDELEWIKFKK